MYLLCYAVDAKFVGLDIGAFLEDIADLVGLGSPASRAGCILVVRGWRSKLWGQVVVVKLVK